MRATRLAEAPAPSARARSLTRVRKQRLGGRAASSRELLLLVRSGVTSDSISKVSITQQWSAAANQGEGAARHVSQPVGCAVARRLPGAREAEGRAGAMSPHLQVPPGPGLAGSGAGWSRLCRRRCREGGVARAGPAGGCWAAKENLKKDKTPS